MTEQVARLDKEALKRTLKGFADITKIPPVSFEDLNVPKVVAEHLQDSFYKGFEQDGTLPQASDFEAVSIVEDTVPGIGMIKTYIFTVEWYREARGQATDAQKMGEVPLRADKRKVNYEMTYFVDTDHSDRVLGFSELGYSSNRFAATETGKVVTKNIPHGMAYVHWNRTLPEHRGKLLSMRRLMLMTAYSKKRYQEFVYSGDMGEFKHGETETDPAKLGTHGEAVRNWMTLADLGLATAAPATARLKHKDRFVLNKVYEN